MDASSPPSAAALLRVDHLLGISYFQDFYGRGMTTFGAFPSMHCAFPMVGLLRLARRGMEDAAASFALCRLW